jgi:NAD(P)-dependent dehydrogenase (short-subunit alcohol dehydrogenase family)
MKLKNKVALVTGSTRGFGFAVAQKFVEEGASVVINGRNKNEIQSAIDKLIERRVLKKQVIIGFQVDLSTHYGANILVLKTTDAFKRIDILVNNAGIYGAKGSVDVVSVDDWINTININLISVFKMCHFTVPYMKEHKHGKIINLSGGGATSPLPNLSGYATSKAAVVRLTETLAAECKDFNIDVNAVAPGALNTRLLDEILEAGESVVGKSFYEKALKQKASGGTSLEFGANLCAFLASDESNGITGKLISAQWDKWKEFPLHKDELMNSDVYTLRRIIAKDRNKTWDVEE